MATDLRTPLEFELKVVRIVIESNVFVPFEKINKSNKMSSFSKTNRQWDLDDVISIYMTEIHSCDDFLLTLDKAPHKNDLPLICYNAKACYQSKDYLHALQVCSQAIKKGYKIPPILMIKGRTLFALKEYETALECFEKAHKMKPSLESQRCVERCKTRIAAESEEISRRVVRFDPQPQPNIQYEWCQSIDYVSVTIFIKNLNQASVNILFSNNSFTFSVPQVPQYTFNFNLSKSIIPEECSYAVSLNKVEIKLKKATQNEKWATLEAL